MAHAEVCPICHKTGKVTGKVGQETCHGCGGKGWIEVRDDIRVDFPKPFIKPLVGRRV